MMGLLLKIASLLPLKYMIMIFFAIAALFTSKLAFILTVVFGMLHLKSIKPKSRIITSLSMPTESFTPYHTFNSGGGYAGTSNSGSNGGNGQLTPSQFSSFASGDGTTGFDTQSSSFITAAAAASSNTVASSIPTQKRRRIHVVYQ